MQLKHGKLIFTFFLISGFCGLLYQVVWMRLAYASFGVITPVVSVVISVFMLGLSIGSWAGGQWIAPLKKHFKKSALFFYAVVELFIGFSAFAVPKLFQLSEGLLLTTGAMNSVTYLFLSAAAIVCSLFLWCVFMGMTFPFMMSFIKEIDPKSTQSFSFLYFANVIGAMAGVSITALVLIEIIGFNQTLLLAAFLNFFIALLSFILSTKYNDKNITLEQPESIIEKPSYLSLSNQNENVFICAILFMTGFISMGMEIVWIRGFTVVLGTETYSFAMLLTVYLLATWLGSFALKKDQKANRVYSTQHCLGFLSVFAFLPIVLNDPRLHMQTLAVLISIFPFCFMLGYLTPKLIDELAQGSPHIAGRAYALNILGSILGPLFASYGLMPFFGVKLSLVLLALPFAVFFFILTYHVIFQKKMVSACAALVIILMGLSIFKTVSYEEMFVNEKGSELRRDYTATVVSRGKGVHPIRLLLVNGIGMTGLTQVVKDMAHLPLILHQGNPTSNLVICFGMGTTYRSLLSWDMKTTAVELIPSVVDAFGYYFDDANAVLQNPNGTVIIDDGRRFLKRTTEKFDVITIDPPPPLETAGSSLLYSEEFYTLAKTRLAKDGILQQWAPGGEWAIIQAIARSLKNSFTYVRVFKAVGFWGYHFTASMSPIEDPSFETVAAKIPTAAQADFMEWMNTQSPDIIALHLSNIFKNEIPLKHVLNPNERISITDDKPFNEYYLLRRRK